MVELHDSDEGDMVRRVYIGEEGVRVGWGGGTQLWRRGGGRLSPGWGGASPLPSLSTHPCSRRRHRE